MIRINLLAPGAEHSEPRPRRLVVPPEQRAALAGLGLLVLTVVVVVTWWWSVVGQRRALAAQFSRTDADVVRLRPSGDLVNRATDRVRALEQRLALVARLRAAQRSPAALLEVVGRSLTDGLWLTELIQDEAGVELRGRALTFVPVADFIDRLQASSYFAGPITIAETSTEAVAGRSIVGFLLRGVPGTPDEAGAGDPAGPSEPRPEGGG